MDTEQTYSSRLALFQKPPVETGIEEIQYIEFGPRNGIFEGSIIEFLILGTSAEYIDLKRTRLKVKARVLMSDGTAIKAENMSDSLTSVCRLFFDK